MQLQASSFVLRFKSFADFTEFSAFSIEPLKASALNDASGF